MTLPTHAVFASVLYLGGATLFGYRPDAVGWLLATVASLLPDIDLPPSKIGRLFWWIFVPLERRFGHRTMTHSAIGIMAVALVASPLWFVEPLYLAHWERSCNLRTYKPPLRRDRLNCTFSFS